MIAGTWHGRVAADKADAYYDYLLRTGLTDYQTTPGNGASWCFGVSTARSRTSR